MVPRVVTLGEIMLRLKAPGYERFLQTPCFEASFGGGEANVAASLAQFGLDVYFITALPSNPIGEACISFLRARNIHTEFIVRRGERIGIYFIEAGANQRPSTVVYDRANSAISSLSPSDIDWDTVFASADWFHITGITPAISQMGSELAIRAVYEAKMRHLTVSCDYNYRKNLWKYGRKPPEIMAEIVKYTDVGIANEEDVQMCLGITPRSSSWEKAIASGELSIDAYRILCETVMNTYPNLQCQAITLRKSYSASHNGWSACLSDGKQFFHSQEYDIKNIVDRVGSGDAFAGGLIYGLITKMPVGDTLNFATAASCWKHSIAGDVNLASVAEINKLMGGDTSGRVQR